VLEVAFTPVAPFRLAQSIGPPDATRRARGGVLDMVFPVASGGTAGARVWQGGDGRVHARIEADDPAAAHDRLHAILGVGLDTREFLRMAASDPLLAPLATRLRGLRPMLVSTPAHALLRALCGQLVRTSDAVRFERRLIGVLGTPERGLRLAPDAAALAAAHPALIERAGLSPRRAVVLTRAARRLNLDALATDPGAVAVARITREPGLGPWTAGVLMVYGYGRHEQGLVGDLALVRLAEALGAESDRELVEPYGPWQGLASIWLMHHPAGARRTRLRAAGIRAGAGRGGPRGAPR
jgi:3-methyladenine DNA glycosylase/8-oxoguanine DNA glycosylase